MYYIYDLSSGATTFAPTKVDAYVKATRILLQRMPYHLDYAHIARATIDMHLKIGRAKVILADANNKPLTVLAPVSVE